ncbi:MAG: hypothetical protein U0556_09925 [Dehalococcoidia bacterium]
MAKLAPERSKQPDTPGYWARRPITYCGSEYDRGQALELAGGTNDERLIRLGYLAELDPKAELSVCAECGAAFTGPGERTGHGNTRHRPHTERSPLDEDRADEREERLLDEIAPLYVDHAAGRR